MKKLFTTFIWVLLLVGLTGNSYAGWKMLEQADALSDIPGYGQVWVNLATPNELWFTDDAGTDFQLGLYQTTIVDSAIWNAAGMVPDGTQCTISSTAVQINSGPLDYTAICTDNDASTLYGHVIMPDSWNAGTVTFELEYVQTAADTNVLNGDIAAMCRGAGETINSTWGTEIAIDDAALTGSNAVDHTTSAAVTADGTCAAGDTLYWRWQMDATGTTTAVATLHILGIKMEFTRATSGD